MISIIHFTLLLYANAGATQLSELRLLIHKNKEGVLNEV